MKRIVKRIFIIFLCCVIVGGIGVGSINLYVIKSIEKSILSPEDAASLKDVDCIIVLGCLVHNNISPSRMLKDRLTVGIELYRSGAAPKILMSGDHGRTKYDEVNVMKNVAVENGVPSEDVFMDHAGFSTYETMYRAKEIFGAKKVIIVTQQYHLSRAVYDAKALGLDAYGVSATLQSYGQESYDNTREAAARCKDFLYCIFKPKPTYLGEPIPITGNGDITVG